MSEKCHIIPYGKYRNGKKKYWCLVHKSIADNQNGQCRKILKKNDTVAKCSYHVNLKDFPGGIAIWGALAPVLDTTNQPSRTGVHLHARKEIGGKKYIDSTFDEIVVQVPILVGTEEFYVNTNAAKYFLISSVFGKQLSYTICPHCGNKHLDEDAFALKFHRKHTCEACGMDFFDTRPSICNPLYKLQELTGCLAEYRKQALAQATLEFKSKDFAGGVKIWASSPAIIWTNPKQEESGIHLHAYTGNRHKEIDDTFSSISINGIILNRDAVQLFMAQINTPSISKYINSLNCSSCGKPHLDKGEYAIKPHKTHLCEYCGSEFEASRKCISNPFKAQKEVLENNEV